MTAFGAREERCKLGFSVTASHNPPEYSGVKFFNGDGMELPKEQELRIERAMVVGANMNSPEFGEVASRDVLGPYLDRLVARFEKVDKGSEDCRGLFQRARSSGHATGIWTRWGTGSFP